MGVPQPDLIRAQNLERRARALRRQAMRRDGSGALAFRSWADELERRAWQLRQGQQHAVAEAPVHAA